MLKNRKGFTLIEILAAITILGILMGIAIVSVTKVIENGKKKHYATAEANMVLAGQSFVQQNRAQLPKAIGQKRKIPMTMLVEKNYIQPIKDYSDNECNMAESYIQVFKYSQDDYSYVSYLECPNYNSQENINDMTPDITAEITEDEDNSKADARIEITGNDKLMSYSYIIYRNGKEVKNTGSVEVKDFAASKSINFSLAEYTPGDIKIVVTATNTYGNTKTKTITKDIPDLKKPKCIIKDEDKADSPKPWIKEGTRKITVGCDDGETGSGCTREEYTKTFKDSMRTGTITIEDEDGNKTNCEVSVYIDKTNPTIKVKAYKQSSTGGKEGSVLKTVETTVSTNSKTINLEDLEASDWLNKAEYPNGIYYELELKDNLELATYKIDRNETGLKKNASNVNTLSHNIDNTTISGTSTDKTTKVSTDGYRKTKAVITDAAGNTAEIMMITPVDRTAPSVPTVNMYKWSNNSTRPTTSTYSGLDTYTNATWSNRSVYTIAGESSDGMSGVSKYQYNARGATSDATNSDGSTRSVEAEGISYVQYRACDVAGNCSAYTSENTIKIDKTPPTCTVTGGSATWINASSSTQKRTITATCVDNGSECDGEYTTISHDYTSDIDTTTAGAAGNNNGGTVYDNAGNAVQCAANQTVKIDKTAPSVPTVTMYKWSSNESSSQPTSSNYSSLTQYASGAWSNKNIYTRASGSTDETSGLKEYQYTTTGQTTAATNTSGTARNVKAEGESTIKYRACDNAGNCSGYSTVQTIKIDKTKPTCTVTGGSTSWINASSNPGSRTITATCSDDRSGCTTSPFSHTYSDNINTTTAGAVGNGSGGSVSDNAGNSENCAADQTVKIDKTVPTVSDVTNNKKDTWTNGNVTITAKAADTGGSNLSATYYYYTSNDLKSDWDTGSTAAAVTGTWSAERNQEVFIIAKDGAGNYSAGVSAGKVMIDKTAPTVPTTGAIGTVSGSNTSASIATTAGGATDTASGVSHYLYLVTNTSTPPTDKSKFGTSTAFTRSCGTSYYAWAITVDNAGNKSDVKGLGSTSDGANSYTNYGACTAECGDSGTQTSSTNTCALITASSTIECNRRSCCNSTEQYSCTDWSWSACTAQCDGGTQYQTRTCYYRSAYDHSTYCSSAEEKQSEGTECGTTPCSEDIYATKFIGCDIYYITTCTSTTCNYTSKNGVAETGTVNRADLKDSRSSSCTTCPSGSTLFGDYKGHISGNYGSSINTSGWSSDWCRASGGPCGPDIGYERVCVVDICRGLIVSQVEALLSGCDYSRAWCSC